MNGIFCDRLYSATKPFRGMIKRVGPEFLKRAVWNMEFNRGEFLHMDLYHGYRSEICDVIEKYCRCGDILDLGCSDGHVGLGLRPSLYSTYLGVDISEVAVRVAYEKLEKYGAGRMGKNNFCRGDISSYMPPRKMDVILFKDSLYYLNNVQIPVALKHYQKGLKPHGVFIVEMDNIKRHGWVRDIIRAKFLLLEDHESKKGTSMRCVFR